MHIVGLPKRECLQCGVEYQPSNEKQVLCQFCIKALGIMPDLVQAFMARMARRIADLEVRVKQLEEPHRKLIRN